ncbi:MAG: hypothetical protein A4E52_00481 [Pelotomaculum sp. PtaB.Bin013]|nr:MAG: hypothetical protein A4E52_00481 [Pelotomaculum sp. PtaB.Bin013]
MTETRIEPLIDEREYFVEKVTIDNVPDLLDNTGATFLKSLEEAIADCRKFIAEEFILTDFWSHPDRGVEFTLKKKKKK